MSKRKVHPAAAMRGKALRHTILAVLSCASVSLSRPSHAQSEDEVAPVEARLEAASSAVAVSFDVTNAFTEDFRRRLGGGLTSRSIIDIRLRDHAGRALSEFRRVCEFRLDIWKDELVVRISDGAKVSTRTFLLTDEALEACGRLERVAMADGASLVDDTGYRLHVTIELNPVSREILERTRAFTANPSGSASAKPRTFFGAVANLFRSDAAPDGETFHFRSQILERPNARAR